MKHERNAAAFVRLSPRTTFNTVLSSAASISLVVIGVIAAVMAAYLARTVLAPVLLAIVIGLMFGPLADRIERFGMSSWVSAGLIVIIFIAALALIATSVALPLSVWIERLPVIWERLRTEAAEWNGLLSSISNMQEGLRTAIGEDAEMTVTLQDESPVRDVAWLAPAIVAQVLLFLASLYFFIATRKEMRVAVLSMFMKRRLRWRFARIFRDVEALVSRYLLSITAVNICLGIAVATALWIAGIPSPALWGVLAFCLNYAVYIGPAIMAVLMLCVGLATAEGAAVFLPPLLYLSLNLTEAQFITPTVVGRAVTINPFVIFLALAFWIWLWGPIGGFIAIPLCLICLAVFRNILPLAQAAPNSR